MRDQAVNEGGQAVVADHFHNHAGGGENAETTEQSHATGSASKSQAMLGHDPQEKGVPITSGERKEALPNARRDKSGRSEG